MRSFEGMAKNFRFMVVQVTKQLESTLRLLDEPDPRLIKAIRDSDDYIDTLKSMIEKDCYEFLGQQRVQDERLVDAVRALNIVTSNLERIADFSVNVARQLRRLRVPASLHRFAYRPALERVLEGVGLISDALFERDSSRALQICQMEDNIDRLYGADLEKIIDGLRVSRDVEDLVTCMFILHYLERMGDALLNIGEAILFAVLGERLKFHQYRVLEEALEGQASEEPALTEAEVDAIWGTRSGVRVGTMEHPTHGVRKVLFKEGNVEKLQAEQQSLERWEKLAPGLAPQVVEFQRQEKGAALLLQYLDGATLQDLVLNAESQIIRRALLRTEHTLRDIWSRTKVSEPCPAGYLDQLRRRLPDVQRVHGDLLEREVRIGALRVPPLDELLDALTPIEAGLPAPFRVYIHGDFNLDNIIYNPVEDTLHFIDLHRSRESDYVQDLSVFLVSGFRMPIFVPRVRHVLEGMTLDFLGFARRFAREHGDTRFEPRLALGLARSLITSTRFELNRSFARTMIDRGLYLLQRLTGQRGRDWSTFRVPDAILIY